MIQIQYMQSAKIKTETSTKIKCKLFATIFWKNENDNKLNDNVNKKLPSSASAYKIQPSIYGQLNYVHMQSI